MLSLDQPPATYARGTNVMNYFGNRGAPCTNNGITASQVALVRKYLRYNMMQVPKEDGGAFIGPDPNPTHRDLLGYRQAEPAHKLNFEGDSKRDVGVYKPPATLAGTGTWQIVFSFGGSMTVSFGKLGDIPVPADYDGDGRTDIAVFRTSGPSGDDPTNQDGYWIYCPSNSFLSDCASPVVIPFGIREDVPIPGTDFDGNPSTGELAVWRARAGRIYWSIAPFTTSQNRSLGTGSGRFVYAMQIDGDNRTDVAQYRPEQTTFRWLKSTNNWDSPGTKVFTASSGSYPVRATSSGKDVFRLYDPQTRTFHTMWTPLTSNTITSCPYGVAGDTALNVDLDWLADGRSDLVLFRRPDSNGNVRFTVRDSTGCTGQIGVVDLGLASSNRVVFFTGADASGDGKPDLFMLNTHTMQWKFLWSQWLLNGPVWSTMTFGDSRDLPL